MKDQITSYEYNREYILKYQKTSLYYKTYKRYYELKYFKDSDRRIKRNLMCAKIMRKKVGKRTSLKWEFEYLLTRMLNAKIQKK